MKKTLLFLCGLSGSGKGFFAKNVLPKGLFTPLKSMTTRGIRDGEIDGIHYYFKTETEFENISFVTYLDVNREVRQPGDPKWLYGVSENEFNSHIGKNLLYDVIQPKYVRQMIDWCDENHPKLYEYKILYFIQPSNGFDIAQKRARMPNDVAVRRKNTSSLVDFHEVSLDIDWAIINYKDKRIYDQSMIDYINNMSQKNHCEPITLQPLTYIESVSEKLLQKVK